MEKYKLSIVQAKAILELRLSRLTALETDKLNEEYEELVKQIKELQEILSNESRLIEVVKEELNEVKENFGDERRTEIVERRLTIDDADLIPEEERVFTISNNGFVKTQQLAEYRSQRRGGVGKNSLRIEGRKILLNKFWSSILMFRFFALQQKVKFIGLKFISFQ